MAAITGCMIRLLVSVPPVPRKQYSEPMDWMRSDPRQDVGEPGLWIHVVHFGRDDQAVHHRSTVAAAIGATEQPRLMPRTARSAALFDRQMRPSSRKRVNALQRLSM